MKCAEANRHSALAALPVCATKNHRPAQRGPAGQRMLQRGDWQGRSTTPTTPTASCCCSASVRSGFTTAATSLGTSRNTGLPRQSGRQGRCLSGHASWPRLEQQPRAGQDPRADRSGDEQRSDQRAARPYTFNHAQGASPRCRLSIKGHRNERADSHHNHRSRVHRQLRQRLRRQPHQTVRRSHRQDLHRRGPFDKHERTFQTK